MLARACGLTPNSGIDPARLVFWAQQAIAKNPKDSWTLHSLGLALLRADQLDQALMRFQASIDAGEDTARNWCGLALTLWRLGRFEEAGRWIEKADDWIVRIESEFADRKTHPSPPIYIPYWLETKILRT